MSDQPPESFERQLSSQEERDVLLNFMGNTYGEIKKLDGNIVGASSTLQATKSEEVKYILKRYLMNLILKFSNLKFSKYRYINLKLN